MRSQGLIGTIFNILETLLNILLVCGVCSCWRKPESSQMHLIGSYNFTETRHGVYEFVSKPTAHQQADKYCKYKFASLLSDTRGIQKLNRNLIQYPIWLNEETTKPKIQPLTVLVFENRTDTKHAKLMTHFTSMPEITVCAHIQWENTNKDFTTVFSYAVPKCNNEFQLRGMIDDDGFVRFAIIVHGQHSRYSPVFPNDGQWHHVCVTWQKWNRTMALYADGEWKDSSKLSASEDIIKEGIFIIGQDQDSYGGTFKEKESFSGNITNLNMWVKVLSQDQIKRVAMCSTLERDVAFRWGTYHLEIEPTVKRLKMDSVCSGHTEKCRVLQNSDGGTNYTSCTAELPFVCYYTQEVYQKLKNTNTMNRDRTFSNRVNMMANRTLISENPLTSDFNQLSPSEALACLEAFEKGLAMEESPVDSVDVLGVIQFLKEVADMDLNNSSETLEELGQHFVHVTGELLEQHDPDLWSEVNPIIKGPMTIIQTVEKMASNLVQLLSDEREEIFIHHKNIEIGVSQVDLNDDRHIYKVQSTERVDEIEVPGTDLKRLMQEGLTEVAVVNTWFSSNSFEHLFGGRNQNFVHGEAAISDGGYNRYVGTYLGSAVISSTILVGEKEISTSVQYYLWHKNDIPRHSDKLHHIPVCAFWDFSIRPENGGSWSTAGCYIKNNLNDATVCFCNHTTTFAVLLQVYDVQRTMEEEWILRTLTFIGCGVSLCALSVTFILFLVVGVPKSERTTVHKNLIFALAAAEALLMFSEMAKPNEVVCITVTACLHLFFMAAFAWMLVEGLLLWSKVVAVNMSEDRRMKFYYITGWGLPIIVVSVTLATSFNNYVADGHCWLNVQTDIIWAFVGPVLFILTVNTFVLFRVVMVTISSARRRSKMLTPNCSIEKQIGIQVWATAKPIIVLLPVLGLTWLCGILVHLSVIWAYTFIFLNAFQGLYIFLIYAIYNTEVRSAIQRMKEKKKALSFTNCSQPTNYLSSPRNTTWDVNKPSLTPPKSNFSEAPLKNAINKGNVVVKHPVNIYSIFPTDNTAVELTSFKTSGTVCFF
ncbi:adhesion G-protein coupled receptor D2 isoform X2 [Pseudophryne corroboree]|uniref:adhesion G-protein coupled receptor D2 isoform X2 n=1 Tax=Pseudophryne corroboree TaxID=495146 RepID=UPI00308134C5